MIKSIFFILIFIAQLLFAQENKVCGVVESFSKKQSDQATWQSYEIQFVNQTKITNVEIENGEQSLIATSIAFGLILCFSQNNNSIYSFSSASFKK